MKIVFLALAFMSTTAMANVICRNKSYVVKATDSVAHIFINNKKVATLKKDFEQDGRPYDGALIQGYSQHTVNGYGLEIHTVHSRLLQREVTSAKVSHGGVAGQTTVAEFKECIRK